MTTQLPLLVISAIALVAHETNRAWCAFNGDASQLAWADAPDWQKASMIAGVEFHLANPDAGDEASHENWMKDKIADGWVYGEVKDPVAKTHPCLVAFDKLPKDQQFKDTLVRTVIHAAAGIPAAVIDGLPAEPAGIDQAAYDAAVALNEAHETAIAALTAENEKLAQGLDKAKGTIGTLQKDLPAKARKIGPVADAVDGEELHALLASDVEIAFSDGVKEIRGIAPRSITGIQNWLRRGTAFVLRADIDVRGPAVGATPYVVQGFGLIDPEGRQVAWCAMPDPVRVPGGETVRFRGNIIF